MIICKKCQKPMDWSDQKLQWGRLKDYNVSSEEVKECLPRCRSCTTLWLLDMGYITHVKKFRI